MSRVPVVAFAALAIAVGALAGMTLQLRGRVAELEARDQRPPSAPASFVPRERARDDVEDGNALAESARVSRAARAPLATAAPALTSGPVDDARSPEAVASVRTAVRDELARADEDRAQAREEQMRSRMRERVAALAKSASLTSTESARVEVLLDAELVEVRSLFQDARDSTDRGALREQIRAVREKTDENVQALLHDDKLAAYQAMRDDERPRRDRGDR